MKRWYIGLVAVALGIGLAMPSYGVSGKIRIAVLDFENNSDWYWWGAHLGRAAADELVTQLVKTGKFSVIERDKLDLVLKEQQLSASGAIDPKTVVRLGKLLGVQLILTGSITKFSIKRHRVGIGPLAASIGQAQSALDVRLINTTTGEIVLIATGQGEKKFGGARYKNVDFRKDFDYGIASEALRPAVEKVVQQILAQYDQLAEIEAAALPPRGKVIKVNSPTMVFIDIGKNADVRVGDRFKVIRVIEEIRDEHGELLDVLEDQVGVLEVTKVLSRSAVCKVVEGSAKPGDRIAKIE